MSAAIPSTYIHMVPMGKHNISKIPKKLQLAELLSFVLPDEIKRDPEALHFIFHNFTKNSFHKTFARQLSDVSDELRTSGYYTMTETQKAAHIRKMIRDAVINPTTSDPTIDSAKIAFTSSKIE